MRCNYNRNSQKKCRKVLEKTTGGIFKETPGEFSGGTVGRICRGILGETPGEILNSMNFWGIVRETVEEFLEELREESFVVFPEKILEEFSSELLISQEIPERTPGRNPRGTT